MISSHLPAYMSYRVRRHERLCKRRARTRPATRAARSTHRTAARALAQALADRAIGHAQSTSVDAPTA